MKTVKRKGRAVKIVQYKDQYEIYVDREICMSGPGQTNPELLKLLSKLDVDYTIKKSIQYDTDGI